jgi:DNA-binding NarL/FixJ family response regulator
MHISNGPGTDADIKNQNSAQATYMAGSAKTPAKTRILVLEEQPLLRDGVSACLNSQPDMIVCGEADNIPDARSKIAECKPHLLLTALRLGIGDSLEFIKALKAEKPGLLILVYAAFKESIFAEWALRAGANGYLMKTAAKEELLTAIRDVLRGQIYVSRDLAMPAFQKSLETSEQNHVSGDLPVIDNLSDREMHVFLLIGAGRGTKKIAHSLRLRVKTIKTHRESIKRKLGLNSGRQLVGRAITYVEENFLPQKGEVAIESKKKVIRFPPA